jgi:hypothetical protein
MYRYSKTPPGVAVTLDRMTGGWRDINGNVCGPPIDEESSDSESSSGELPQTFNPKKNVSFAEKPISTLSAVPSMTMVSRPIATTLQSVSKDELEQPLVKRVPQTNSQYLPPKSGTKTDDSDSDADSDESDTDIHDSADEPWLHAAQNTPTDVFCRSPLAYEIDSYRSHQQRMDPLLDKLFEVGRFSVVSKEHHFSERDVDNIVEFVQKNRNQFRTFVKQFRGETSHSVMMYIQEILRERFSSLITIEKQSYRGTDNKRVYSFRLKNGAIDDTLLSSPQERPVSIRLEKIEAW